MTTTFFVLGLAILTVAYGIRRAHQPSFSARVGFGLLVVGPVFVSLAGVFRGFPLHDVASAVGLPSLVIAALLLSWSFRTAAGRQAIHPATFLITVGMLAAIVSMVVDVGMPGRRLHLTGVPELGRRRNNRLPPGAPSSGISSQPSSLCATSDRVAASSSHTVVTK